MRIRTLADNRLFEGTPLEIVRQMRAIAGEEAVPLAQYIHILVARAARVLVFIDIPDAPLDQQAEALVRAMLDKGLARVAHPEEEI